MKILNNLYKFMNNRYGIDELYKFFLKILFVLVIINLFIKNNIISIIEIILIFIMFYRFLSKNITRRNKENKFFLKIKKCLLKPFDNIKRNILDKNHVYKKCFKCKTILKLPLPNKIGFKVAKCPKCANRVKFFTFKYQHIEVIKKK